MTLVRLEEKLKIMSIKKKEEKRCSIKQTYSIKNSFCDCVNNVIIVDIPFFHLSGIMFNIKCPN